jgi:hypothetical protein
MIPRRTVFNETGEMQSKAKENKNLDDSVPASASGINAVNRKELPGFGGHGNRRMYHPQLKKSLLDAF